MNPRMIVGHLKIMADRIGSQDYQLSERQIKMLTTLIREINLEQPEPKPDDEWER